MDLKDLSNEMFDFIRKKMQEAFDAGRRAERELIMNKISGAVSKDMTTPVLTLRRKAPRCSGVTATILHLIGETENGITSLDLISKTGFKKPSIYGILAMLKSSGKIFKKEGRWFMSAAHSALNGAAINQKPPC